MVATLPDQEERKKLENNIYYVYEYIRLDTNEPFYVGKGCKNRWCNTKQRNKYFKNIISKIPVAVHILHENLSEIEAFEYECWYINEYKYNMSYDLTNIIDGGEGGDTRSGNSEENIKLNKKQSISSRGMNAILNEEKVKKIKIEILNNIDMHYIAKKYSVNYTTICKIKTCKNWEWVCSELNNKLLTMNKDQDDKIIDYYYSNPHLSMVQIGLDLNTAYGRVRKLISDKIKLESRNIIGVNLKNQLYKSRITIKGKEIHLGHYRELKYAEKVRLIAEIVYLKDKSPQKHKLKKYDLDFKDIDINTLNEFINKYSTKSTVKIICLTTGVIFNSFKEAENFYRINNFSKNGYLCLTGKRKTFGKHPITGEPLKWQYYDEYIKSNQLPTAI